MIYFISLKKFYISMYIYFATIPSVNFFNMRCDVPELKGDNYKVWKERILLHLGWINIDYVIRKNEPPAITETSSQDAISLYEK